MAQVASGFAWNIEGALTRHYLRTDGPFGPTPLRFIDATDEELARAIRVDDPDEARRRFLASFDAVVVRDVFRHGYSPRSTKDSEYPGFFRYLMLSCVIACTAEDSSRYGDFRRRLCEQLGGGVNFVEIPGVAKMWKALRNWCADVGRRDQFREVVLPHPGSWNQIGHTLKITFPARADLQRMERLFGEREGKSSPPLIVQMVNEDLRRHNWSDAFRSAFEDFENRVALGHRLLASHPFWLAMQRISPNGDDDPDELVDSIEIRTDIEGDTIVTVTSKDSQVLAAVGFSAPRSAAGETMSLDVTVEAIIGLLTRTSCRSLRSLARSVQEGILPFEDSGVGSWRATRNPDTAKVRLLVRPDLARRYDLRGVDHGWILTNPCRVDFALESISAARRTNTVGGALKIARLVGGIRIAGGFLGLAFCLPQISASSDSTFSFAPSPGAQGGLALGEQDGAHFALSCERRISGEWTIKVAEGECRVANVVANFRSNSDEHDLSVFTIDEDRWRAERDVEAEFNKGPVAEAVADSKLASFELVCPEFDLAEAVYAGGENGWSEQDLVPLIRSALGRSLISPWDALRILADSGWLQPRMSTSWRARKWFLRPPRLLQTGAGVVLLDGASCAITRARFAACVERAGGRIDAKGIAGAWCIPALSAVGVSADDLVEDTGIPIGVPTGELPLPNHRMRLRRSEYSALGRNAAGVWSWSEGRFVATCETDPLLPLLERLQHIENRSNDVYRVAWKDRLEMFDSRTAAIVCACHTASRPMFELDSASGTLRRLLGEGWLPASVALYLRMRHLAGPAMTAHGGRRQFAYPADRRDVAAIATWLGDIVSREGEDADCEQRVALMKVVLANRGLRQTNVLARRWAEGRRDG